MKTGREKTKKIIVVGAIAATCLVLLAVIWLCVSSEDEEGIGDVLRPDNKNGITTAGGTFSQRPAVQEQGIFYIDVNRLSFYDYEREKSYVLCPDKKCRHTTSDCNAYVGDKAVRAGYAMCGDHVYLICADERMSDAQLISMDLKGDNRRTVAEFGEKTTGMDGCAISGISDVIYADGYVYLNFTLFKNEQGQIFNGQQLLAVRLQDGQIIKLTDVLYSEETLGYEIVSEKNVIYSVQSYDPPLPTFEEYLEEHPGTEESDYYNAVHDNNPERKICYYDFLPETGEINFRYEEKMDIYEDFLGYQQRMPGMNFFGEINGKWLMSINNTKNILGESTLFLWNPCTEEKEILAEVDGGEGYYGVASYADVSNVLYNEKEILWIEPVPDSNTQDELFLYNIETKEKRKLYDINSEKEDYSLDLRGVTDKYVITARRNALNQLVYYVTLKKDFEKSCLKEARETSVVIR